MTAVLADTFYWIALADFSVSAHQRALTVTAERAASAIITTDEVLSEYLTFFATAPEALRRQVAALPFWPASAFTLSGPTRATAREIAFRCRRCPRKG